jgi:Flp pilus assembly protein TadG
MGQTISKHRKRGSLSREAKRRRGAAIILAAFLMGVLVSMLALSIDIGYIAASKAEARRTADAAALAGAWQMVDTAAQSGNTSTLLEGVNDVAKNMASLNLVCNSAPSLSIKGQETDITIGYLSSLESSATLSTDSNNPYRAVRARVRKNEASNGQVPLFFARFFGQTGRDMIVESTAATAMQIKGFKDPASGSANLNLLPFALDEQTWTALLNGTGSDNYEFTSGNSSVAGGTDGIKEVNLYPQGTGSPGNRGTVDIGSSNNSTADLSRQITDGISAQDLYGLGKPLILNDNGSMTLNGDTGISAGVKDELASIIGQTRIIPVFSSVTGNGNNATYSIVRWVGVRIMAVKLTGSMSSKYLIVQPASVIARNVVVGDSTRVWSDSIYSPVVLVK